MNIKEITYIKRLLDGLEEIAESPCGYGDGCPSQGTRHGRCTPCKARYSIAYAKEALQ